MNKIKTESFRRVWESWEAYAVNFPDREAIIHWDALGEPHRWTFGDLYAEACSIAYELKCQKVEAGDVCALIMRHNKAFYVFYLAIALIGAIPAVLAYPNPRLHPEKFLHGLTGMAKKSGLDWLLTERDLEHALAPLKLIEQSSIKGFLFPLEWERLSKPPQLGSELRGRRPVGNEDSAPFLLQHSSGTTGLQKAVVLSHKAVLGHARRYAQAIRLTEKDKILNWLPLYHDMGLIVAFHMPLIFGIPSVQMDPFQWIVAPELFFQVASKEMATLAWLPNFSFNLMADRVNEEDLENVSLSELRMIVNCSEVVRPESMQKFVDRFQAYGIKKESLAASYAMAEATFSVTQTDPGVQVKSLVVDRDALARMLVQPPLPGSAVKACASSGRPIADCFVKIVDEKGDALPAGHVGKIVIKSASLFDGYRNDPEKTAAVMRGGWYVTGDFGFFYEGEYFVMGRGDDVIINGGRNIFPEDIEDAVLGVKGVLPGRVVAFGMENVLAGTQDIHVAAETSVESSEEKNALVLAIKQAGMGVDITISQVHLVAPRWLIKSSSGKISRKMNRERILESLKGGKV